MEFDMSLGRADAITKIIKAFDSSPETRLTEKQFEILLAMREEEYKIQNEMINKMLSIETV